MEDIDVAMPDLAAKCGEIQPAWLYLSFLPEVGKAIVTRTVESLGAGPVTGRTNLRNA